MKVLIAIDESEFIECLAKHVTSREWPARTEFLVVNVVEPMRPMITALPAPIIETLVADAHKNASHLVRRMAMKIRDAFKTEHVLEEVLDGFAGDAIIKKANDWNANLIVVGAHRKNLFDRIMLGSISSEVMSHAPCSIAIVRPAASAQPEKQGHETSADTEHKEPAQV